VKRSNLAFSEEIATHPSGARNDRRNRNMPSLSLDLGLCLLIFKDLKNYLISFPESIRDRQSGMTDSHWNRVRYEQGRLSDIVLLVTDGCRKV
jgi:hypothetical protein